MAVLFKHDFPYSASESHSMTMKGLRTSTSHYKHPIYGCNHAKTKRVRHVSTSLLKQSSYRLPMSHTMRSGICCSTGRGSRVLALHLFPLVGKSRKSPGSLTTRSVNTCSERGPRWETLFRQQFRTLFEEDKEVC